MKTYGTILTLEEMIKETIFKGIFIMPGELLIFDEKKNIIKKLLNFNFEKKIFKFKHKKDY